ncbi:MAG: archease [Sulfuricaulis sp.]
MGGKRWEHFPHEADMGVRGIGNTKEEAFEQGALAMCAVITDPAKICNDMKVDISCQAPDDELLFVDWLNALIYEMATRKWIFSHFEVHIKDHELSARIGGEPMDAARHRLTVEIKGATYTALRVAREINGEWVAQCVVDV